MPCPPGPADLLADLAHEFARLRVPWYVFGAQAALIWGRPRLTTDVDVTVRLGALDSRAFVNALHERLIVTGSVVSLLVMSSQSRTRSAIFTVRCCSMLVRAAMPVRQARAPARESGNCM